MHRLAERRVTYLWLTIALALIAGLAITLTTSQSQAKTRTRTATAAKPTVVLVNGAWANNAAWSGVIERLQTEGYTVDAPPNPLQSLKGDAATIADLLKTIKGPIVLVGHSYGGAVITNAATGNRNVKALVYVDAFAPAKGESVLGLDSTKPGSALGAGPTKVFNFVPFPGAKKGDAELYVKPSVFEQAFANGLPAKEGAVLAATQSPVGLQRGHGAFGDARVEDDPELVRAGDDRQGDPARHSAVHGSADSRPHHQGQGRASLDGGRSRSGREGDHGRGEGNELRPVRVGAWSRSTRDARSGAPAHGTCKPK